MPNGYYGFTGLTLGDYFVEIEPPTGLIVTRNDQGTNDLGDSDGDPITGRTPMISIAPDEYDPTWDFGLVAPGSLGDTIWLDSNYNGLQEKTEPGMPGITVNLYDLDGTLLSHDCYKWRWRILLR